MPLRPILGALTLVLLGGAAHAATFNVTRFDDPPPGACSSGDCSLREAVIAANGSAGSIIVIPAGTVTLTIPGADNAVTNEAIGDLDIRVSITIVGAGTSSTIVQAQQIHRIFDNHSPGNVYIANMTIRNGYDVEAGSGGCIRNLGTLTLESVTVSGCGSAVGGGGIASYHLLTVINSTITGNSVNSPSGATVNGGGIAGGPGPALGTGSTVSIVGTTISNNTVSSVGNVDLTALGGGFANTATMTITSSVVSGNGALNVGGGINVGTMTIRDTTVNGNTARYDVGGVDNDATMTISNCTFSNNRAGVNCQGSQCNRAFAGGALNTAGGTMYVDNSTFSGNSCLVSGGGLLNAAGTLTITSSTIAGNTCPLSAGVGASDTVFITNSIVANNSAGGSGGDCGGILTSQGYNLIENTTGCTVSGSGTGNVIGQDPALGPLQNNGGPTTTMALLGSSPAINRGNPNGCRDHAGAVLQGDQRGYAKPQQGRCDMGALETGIDALAVYRLRNPGNGSYLFTLYPLERDLAVLKYGFIHEGVCCNWLVSQASGRSPLFRLRSDARGEYLFTISTAERDSAVSQYGYIFEGVAAYTYTGSPPASRPWFRLRRGDKHLYTIYTEERDAAVLLYGFIYEGVCCHLPAP